jgi:hypothetical protein
MSWLKKNNTLSDYPAESVSEDEFAAVAKAFSFTSASSILDGFPT